MPGISGTARLIKSAAMSKTTKAAVKKAAKSDVVKTTVSGIVVDAALPEIKERVAQRLNPDESTQSDEENQTSTPGDLGKWNEPTTLGLDSELYAQYLRNQIHVLSEYETHLEDYVSPEYEAYVDAFHARCEEPALQLHAAQLVAESLETYMKHLQVYAVRNDDFREYILTGPEEPKVDQAGPAAKGDTQEALERVEESVEQLSEYINYLTDYIDKDPEFASHVSSYGHLIKGSIGDLESAVLAELQYLSYLEQYTENDEDFQNHVDAFSLDSEAYYSLIETENQLLKRLQDQSS